jgi:hypothetical protein
MIEKVALAAPLWDAVVLAAAAAPAPAGEPVVDEADEISAEPVNT